MADENDTVANAEIESTEVESVVDTSELDSLMSTIEGLGDVPDVEVKPDIPEIKPEVMEVNVEDKKPEITEADRGLERLAVKEKEFRTQKEEFEKNVSQYIKIGDLNQSTSAALQKAGLDPDVVMKTILWEKLPDNSPVKAKLKAELSEILTDRKIRELKEQVESEKKQNQIAQENARRYQDTVRNIETYVDKLRVEDNKTLTNVSLFGKEDANGLKDFIWEEILNDAARRFTRGEEGDPISHEEAANRIEKRLARFAALYNKSNANKNETGNNNAAGVLPKKKGVTVKPGPASPKGKLQKTSQEEADDLVQNIISGRI